MYTLGHKYLSKQAYTSAVMHPLTGIHTHTYTYIHIHTHAYTYIQIHSYVNTWGGVGVGV